jgi:hypothetical protein
VGEDDERERWGVGVRGGGSEERGEREKRSGESASCEFDDGRCRGQARRHKKPFTLASRNRMTTVVQSDFHE